MQLDIREIVQQTILEERIWEPMTTHYICEILKPGHVFLDIGANSGYFTLVGAKCVSPSGRVLSVEPNPAMAEQVRRNAARSRITNVEVEEVACTDSAGNRRLYIGGPYNTGNSSLSSQNLMLEYYVDVTCTEADTLVRKHSLSRG